MSNGTSLLLEVQVGFDVIKDEKPLLLVELIKVKRALRIVNLLLKHLAKILYVDVRVLDHLVGCLTDEDNTISRFVK
jgi:hypothetical protein